MKRSSLSKDDAWVLKTLINQLPPKQRRAITLRFWGQQSIFEIAAAMRVTWGEADELLNVAIQNLKKECMNHPRLMRGARLSLVA